MGSPGNSRPFGALRLVARPAETPNDPGRAPSDDSALLEAIRAGRPGVASWICERLAAPVNRTVRRLLGRLDSDRDDLAQLSLMEIVYSIDRYRGDCSLDRWAQTVTAHVVFKHIRRRNLESRLFAELLPEVHPAIAPVEHSSTTRQLLTRVAGHLDQMRVERVWAFLLHDVLGYDLDEMADMTGVSVSAAQSRLSRGRRELHARIADDPDLADLLGGGEQRSRPGHGAESEGGWKDR